MLMFILDRHFQRLGVIDTETIDHTRFNFNTENQTYTITDGVLLSTFTASFNKNYEESEHLVIGNYIAFKDEWDKTWCFTINEIPNETTYTREIYCEDLGLDLLNSASLAYPSNGKQKIDYYLNRELNDSGWTIGLNEIGTTKEISFDTSSTALKRLQDIATAFECEIYFDIKFNANQLVEQKVNIVKQIGVEKPKERLTTEQDITEIKRTISYKDLKTACYAFGANNTGIETLSYNDGKYISNYGSNLVVSMEASQLYNRFPVQGYKDRGYFEMVNTSESSEKNQILADAIKALSAVDKPKITYEATVLFDSTKGVSIGDTIQLVDMYYNPKLLLEARVTGFEVSRTNSQNNKVTISNYKLKDDGISQLIKDFQSTNNRLDDIEEQQVSVTITEEKKGQYVQMTAQVWKGNINITSQFSDKDFVWRKTDITGREDVRFNTDHKADGNKITVDLNDVDRSCEITCSVLYHPFVFVSKPWFQNGLKSLATRLKNEKEDGDTAVIFATDLHQANQSYIRDNRPFLYKAVDHIKNMVELTKMADIDLIVLGGDNADGSCAKPLQIQSLKDVMNTLEESSAPYVVCRGNHDNNNWYAKVLSKDNPSCSNIITADELRDILAKPSKKFKNIDVQDCYYSVDINNIRHIVLNSSDYPDLINNDSPLFLDAYAYQEGQINWLVDKLQNNNGMDICVYQHLPFYKTFKYKDGQGNAMPAYNDDVIKGILDAFQNKKSYYAFRSSETSHFPCQVSVDFSKSKGRIIYGIYGHTHNDRLTKSQNIQYISTSSCGGVERKVYGTGPLSKRVENTLTEDLWDVLLIKPKQRKVKILRYGQGEDREVSY